MIALWIRIEGIHSEFWYDPWGQGQGGVAPKGPKSILHKHSHIVYQIEGYEE